MGAVRAVAVGDDRDHRPAHLRLADQPERREHVSPHAARAEARLLTMLLIPALALSLALVSAPALAPGECVVVAPLDGAPAVFGGDECARRTLPASTFKVPHALIALETQVVTDKTVVTWDGTKRDYEVWNHDQTLESSIRMSAVWVFQRFAAAIGRERELASLRAFHYGSQTFEHDVTTFWLNGDLQISPVEQIAF